MKTETATSEYMSVRGVKMSTIPASEADKLSTKIERKIRPKQYSKVPATVFRDVDLTPCARIVFAELVAWQFAKSAIVTRGNAAIAEAIGANEKSVRRSIRDLAARGHLLVLSKGRNRGKYFLTSVIFGCKADLRDPAVKAAALKDGELWRRLASA